MSVAVDGDVIALSGRCPAEDAEALLAALGDHPGARVDLTAVQRLHTAVLQILLALRPRLVGKPAEPLLRQIVSSSLDLE